MSSTFNTRPSKGGRVIFSLILAAVLGGALPVLAASKVAPPGGAIDAEKEAAHIREVSTLDDSQDDMDAVQDVCTRCHSSFQYLTTPRSSERWQQVFAEMTGYGADPTDEQVDQIVRYFQRNLMVVNVNSSPPEELGPTLQVSEFTALQIVARRQQKPFTGLDDLASVPGVNKDVLVKLKTNLQF